MSKKFLVINISLSFLLSAFLFVSIYISNPAHLLQDDNFKTPLSENHFNNFINPDALHYYIMGKILLEHGVFSRDLNDPEGHPDILRTPAYPVLLAMLRAVTKKAFIIYIVHTVLYMFAIYFLMKLCFLITKSGPASFIAGLFMALNISCYAYIYYSMAEIFYIFLTVASLYYFALLCDCVNKTKLKQALYAVVLLAVFTAINVLTRNAVKMLIIIYIVSIFFFLKTSFKKKLLYIFLLFSVYLILIFPWMYRNHKNFGIWQLSNSQEINLVYLSGAGAFGMKHKVDINGARNIISREYNIPSYYEVCNPWVMDNPITPLEMSSQLKKVIPDILFKYPYQLVAGAVIGVVKGHLLHSTQDFAAQLGVPWIKPQLSMVAQGKFKELINIIFSNDRIVVFLFIFQNIYFLFFYLFLFMGTFYMVRQFLQHSLTVWFTPVNVMLFLSLIYFILIIGVAHYYNQSRFRMLAEIIYYLVVAKSYCFFKKD